MKLEYVVVVPQDLAAGLYGFTEEVIIDFDGKHDIETQMEATEYFRKAIAQWFDGGRVATKAEYADEQLLIDKQIEGAP